MYSFRNAIPADFPGIQKILDRVSLPVDGVQSHLQNFLVYETAGEIVACGGFEAYFPAVLVRSVAVLPAYRGKGIGQNLIRTLLEKFRAEQFKKVFLLTFDAEEYFQRHFGFQAVNRFQAPPAIRNSVEFITACPQSAICMVKYLV